MNAWPTPQYFPGPTPAPFAPNDFPPYLPLPERIFEGFEVGEYVGVTFTSSGAAIAALN